MSYDGAPVVPAYTELDMTSLKLAQKTQLVSEGLSLLADAARGMPNLAWLLPAVFRIGKHPFTLDNHYQFEPFFDVDMPQRMVTKAARQLGKSLQTAARTILLSWRIPGYKTLFVTPLSDQARRLSADYFGNLIENSPMSRAWAKSGADRAVWRRSVGESMIYFSFAKLDAERIRSYSVYEVAIDEAQDMNPDHPPVIRETMSAHWQWGLERWSGTPKTPEGYLESVWQDSSMAEWFIPCYRCNFDNIPAIEHHLEKMIGPLDRPEEWGPISDHSPGLVCARCRRPVQPRDGWWHHRHPSKAEEFPGLHISQPIAWTHYAHANQWAKLIQKQNSYSPQRFHNEVLGESYGVGTQLISREELRRAASLPWDNTPDDPRRALQYLRGYQCLCLAVDWGGGGEKGLSLTVVTLMGMASNGHIHVIWGKRMFNPDHIEQAKEIYDLFRLFNCRFIAHDFTGAGLGREAMLNRTGISKSQLIPMSLQTLPGLNTIKLKKGSGQRPRNYFIIDKPKSLQITCAAIRLELVNFFRYDARSVEEPGLIQDFLALIENLADSTRSGSIYTIIRNSSKPDDFAQAVNIGCCALWQSTGTWPDLNLYGHLRDKLASMKTHEDDVELDDDFQVDPDELDSL